MPRHRALTLISPFLNLQLSLVLLRRGDKMTLQDKAFLSSLSYFKEEDISLLYMISNHVRVLTKNHDRLSLSTLCQ